MRPLKSHAPYCVYRKQTKAGYFWYVRYWDEASRKYACIRSTGIPVKGRGGGRHDAEEAARTMLPQIRFNPDTSSKPFTQYVADFWKDTSPYVQEYAAVKKRPLSAAYVKLHRDDVRRHIEPFPGFRGITIYTLTPGIVRNWMRWAAEKGLAGGRINKVMQAMSVAVRYAVSGGKLERDPFKNIREPRIPGRKRVYSHLPRLPLLSGRRCGISGGGLPFSWGRSAACGWGKSGVCFGEILGMR
jgi:hypothetical protein